MEGIILWLVALLLPLIAYKIFLSRAKIETVNRYKIVGVILIGIFSFFLGLWFYLLVVFLFSVQFYYPLIALLVANLFVVNNLGMADYLYKKKVKKIERDKENKIWAKKKVRAMGIS